jgi:hypothetical protein
MGGGAFTYLRCVLHSSQENGRSPLVILCMEEFEDTLNMYIVGRLHISVMSVINHCWKIQLIIGGRINLPVIPVLRPQHEHECSLRCVSAYTGEPVFTFDVHHIPRRRTDVPLSVSLTTQ